MILSWESACFLGNKPDVKELTRGEFDTVSVKKNRKVNYPGLSIVLRNKKLIIKARKEKKLFTMKGTFLHNEESSDKSSVRVIQHLNGKYIIDFFSVFPVVVNRDSQALLDIFPAAGSDSLDFLKPRKSIKLEKGMLLKRYQIPIEIKKKESLVFSLQGKGIIALSEPVFYPAKDYKKKELVFIISADTLRQDHVGVYNNQKKTTPEINRFSSDAVIFANAYSGSSWTLPAHASLFTAIYSNRQNLNLHKPQQTKLLKNSLFIPLQKKYITISYNGGVFLSHLYGFYRGFDFYHQHKDDTNDPFSAKLMFRGAVDNLQSDHYNVPTLFFLHTYQIHSLFHPEKKLAKQYFENKPVKYDSFEILELTEYGKNQYNRNVSPEDRAEIIKIYDAGIYTFDYRFGKFIQYLREKKLYKDSLIILLSDHGEAFGDHGGWEHGHTLYNELIKIPLIVKFPENKWAGSRVDHVVSIVDVLPTLLELDHIRYKSEKENNISGISLIETIKAKKTDREVVSYLAPYGCSRTPMKVSIIGKRYKIIYNENYTKSDLDYYISPPPKLFKFELYDQLKDPFEIENVKDLQRAEFSKMVKTLKVLEYNKEKVSYPKELHKKLKQLGYLD